MFEVSYNSSNCIFTICTALNPMAFYPNGYSHQLEQVSSLAELLRYRARHQTDQVAYIALKEGETEAGQLTYQALDQQARAIAAHLHALGANGSRVLLTYPLSASLEFTAAFFGCLYAGAVVVTAWPPLNNALLSELLYKVSDAGVAFALTTRSLLTQCRQQLASNPQLAELPWVATDEAVNTASVMNADWREPAIGQASLAYLQYTSGSTGLPKGAMITHGNVLDNLGLISQSCRYQPNDLGVCWLPLYHDMGLVGAVIQPTYVGGTVVLMSPVDFILKPLRWLQAISRYRAITSGGPNFAYDLCVRKSTPEQRAKLDLSCWEIAVNGAEPVLAETMARFAETFGPCGFRREAFCPAYGMAETTVMISLASSKTYLVVKAVQRQALEHNSIQPVASNEPAEIRQVVGCGQIGRNHALRIVDPYTLRGCSADQVGEIWISGPSVAQGYWNRPEETTKIFNAYLTTGEGPFLRTGDMGFLQGDELFITGRLKDVIILWGRNHYAHHIERTVEQSHPALRPGGGAVFGVDVGGEQQLVVTQEVESRSLKNLDKSAVMESIRKALVLHHMVEAHTIVLLRPGSAPKTPTGKIQRAACRTKFLEGSLNMIGQWRNSCTAEGIVLDDELVAASR